MTKPFGIDGRPAEVMPRPTLANTRPPATVTPPQLSVGLVPVPVPSDIGSRASAAPVAESTTSRKPGGVDGEEEPVGLGDRRPPVDRVGERRHPADVARVGVDGPQVAADRVRAVDGLAVVGGGADHAADRRRARRAAPWRSAPWCRRRRSARRRTSGRRTRRGDRRRRRRGSASCRSRGRGCRTRGRPRTASRRPGRTGRCRRGRGSTPRRRPCTSRRSDRRWRGCGRGRASGRRWCSGARPRR